MKAFPVHRRGEMATLALLEARDAPWIRELIDEAEAAVGSPWRQLLERFASRSVRTEAARRDAAVEALRRMLSGADGGALRSVDARRELLGRAVLDRERRDARVAEVAATLSVTVEELERALWADLYAERTVVMPAGRPAEADVAAAANLWIIQRAMLRCHGLKLQVSGNARAIARTAAMRGLVATATAQGPSFVLEVSGPLALFHRTTVYGRALGALVPQLARCDSFTLDARCDFGWGAVTLRLQQPILLPPPPPAGEHDGALIDRFERSLDKRAPRWQVLRESEPIDAHGHLVFPDFVLQHRDEPERRWCVEIVGFWTRDYLRRKRDTYRRAHRQNVIFCIDAQRTVGVDDGPEEALVHTVRFARSISVEEVLAIVDA